MSTKIDYNELAREYRREDTSDRRRGKIVEIVADRYWNKYYKESFKIIQRDREDFIQWYYYKCIYALNKWKDDGKASFITYLHICLKGTLQTYLNNDYKKHQKKMYEKYDYQPIEVILCPSWDNTSITYDTLNIGWSDDNNDDMFYDARWEYVSPTQRS